MSDEREAPTVEGLLDIVREFGVCRYGEGRDGRIDRNLDFIVKRMEDYATRLAGADARAVLKELAVADALEVLRELVALKRMHDAIEAAEADGGVNFVDSMPLPFVKDEYARRKPIAWGAAHALVGPFTKESPCACGAYGGPKSHKKSCAHAAKGAQA